MAHLQNCSIFTFGLKSNITNVIGNLNFPIRRQTFRIRDILTASTINACIVHSNLTKTQTSTELSGHWRLFVLVYLFHFFLAPCARLSWSLSFWVLVKLYRIVSYRIGADFWNFWPRMFRTATFIFPAYYVISLMNEATPISYKGDDILVIWRIICEIMALE